MRMSEHPLAYEASKALKTNLFLQGRVAEISQSDPTTSTDWNVFSQSWNDLVQDQYMGDGGTYRFRRYSEFHLAQGAGLLQALSHAPYRQSKEDNYLNGGIDRLYSPMREDIQMNAVLKQILFYFADVIVPLSLSTEWLVQVFQNRIIASKDQPGQPTPEGIHRDGVDFVLTLLIHRENVSGGESSTYAQDGKTLQASILLEKPGDYIFLNDKLMKHSVHPIKRTDPDKAGYRDALIAMFTQRSGDK